MSKQMRVGVVLLVAGALCVTGMTIAEAKEQWRLGTQAYSFNRFTFYEAVAKTKSVGLNYIEAYPGQKLSEEHGDATLDHNMSPALRLQVMEMLKEQGIRLVNYGVVSLPNNEDECRKVFDFARDMGIQTIVSEPPEDGFDLIDKLCQEYRIGVAIHNHPKPSHYWNPDTVLKVCEGHSKWIGACADTGHWMRSGVDPVEAIKKLGMAGRIRSLHFKDLNEFDNPSAHDVIWGTGAGKAGEVLAELASQKFDGVFSIEYEYHWENSLPEIAGCVEWFNRVASDMGVSKWSYLFNGKDLAGWDGDPRFWSVKDGIIHGETTPEKPTQDNTFLVYRGGQFSDFVFNLKFRIQNGNSGVQYRSKEFDRWRIGGYQAEVENAQGKVGFLYHEAGRGWLVDVGDFMLIDAKGEKKVIGNVNDQKALIDTNYYKEKDWNEYIIVCQGNHVTHYLNGFQTIELIDNDRIVNPDDPKDQKGAPRTGLLALQIHAGPPMVVEFKDIRIKQIPAVYGDAVLAFNGQDLSEWEANGSSGNANKWAVGKAKVSASNPKLLEKVDGMGELINRTSAHGESQDLYSKAKFGDCRIEVEVMVPQGSNSGIYVMGEYEIQVLDSYGRMRMNNSDMGAIYGGFSPPVNASKRPGQWQQYVIEFRAPRFDTDGKKIQNAEFIKVELNGQVLHENIVMPEQTPGGLTGTESAVGPLMFQGNHGPVAYRNIIVKPLLK